jgi:hypothetical protein
MRELASRVLITSIIQNGEARFPTAHFLAVGEGKSPSKDFSGTL